MMLLTGLLNLLMVVFALGEREWRQTEPREQQQAKWAPAMRALFVTAVGLSGFGGPACAQASDDGLAGAKACLQSASAANAACYDPATSADERLDCVREAHTAQLECLMRIAPEASAGSQRTGEGDGARTAPEVPSGAASQETATGRALSDARNASPARTVDLPAIPASPTATWIVSETTSPVDYAPSLTATVRLSPSGMNTPNALVIRCHQSRTELLVRTEGTWHMSPSSIARTDHRRNDKPLPNSPWNSFASQPSPNAKPDGPSRASQISQVQVGYQINEQPFVRSPWAASDDGKTASYKGDVVGFLQSLPEAARLRITVLDGPGVGHEAVFKLDGFDAVRKKLAATCKWASAITNMTSKRR
jgi:hypothetical protein